MTSPPHSLLIVEDDQEIGSLVRDLLVREGFDVRLARSGIEMDQSLKAQGLPTMLLLDLMLPGEDGFSICRRLRAQHDMPILMLTAKSDDIDRIVGLELGADDYLCKPFNPRELLARVRAILRRAVPVAAAAPTATTERLHFAGYTFEPAMRRLLRADASEVPLLTGDFELLQVFVEHPMRVLTRDQLMDWIKGRSWDALDRSIDVAISRLRRKIEPDATAPCLIKTVRNGGYLFAVPVERS
ncbi:MAG: response regulator [Nevskia sp.]|jgi:two-component system OmpR family response regulator|nr:response regulator [Nevskia sp.]MCK9383675.1 response regulator [Nevskia sp.]